MRSYTHLFTALALSLAACSSSLSGGDNNPKDDGLDIVGGITDAGHSYVVGVGDDNEAFCTGTVISKRTVITAGHCFGGITRVYFGKTLNAGSIAVVKEIRHPNYNTSTMANDVTVLQLAQDAPVQPAPLYRQTMDNSATFIGPEFTFVGYGITSGATQAGFGTRRVVTFPIEKVGPGSVGGTAGTLQSSQFYYQRPGENTCNGDSGGPAFFVQDGVEFHVGVTSFGDGPCTFDGVDTRTDQPMITSFIQAKIDQFEGSDPCRSNGVCQESCNTGGQVKDPDCAANHCAADGICSLSCVAPIDPDCLGDNVNHCGDDGVCDPSCSSDPNCESLCGNSDCGGSSNPNNLCGDGFVDPGEQCDDGNNVSGDGCSASCQAESGETFVGSATDTPISIPDNQTSFTASLLNVASDMSVQSGEVRVSISHTWRGDLEVRLVSPSGQVQNLVARNSSDSGDNINAVFPVTLTNSAQGTWRLEVRDLAAQDVGRIEEFSLALNTRF